MIHQKRIFCPACNARLFDIIMNIQHLYVRIRAGDEEDHICIKCVRCGKEVGITVK